MSVTDLSWVARQSGNTFDVPDASHLYWARWETKAASPQSSLCTSKPQVRSLGRCRWDPIWTDLVSCQLSPWWLEIIGSHQRMLAHRLHQSGLPQSAELCHLREKERERDKYANIIQQRQVVIKGNSIGADSGLWVCQRLGSMLHGGLETGCLAAERQRERERETRGRERDKTAIWNQTGSILQPHTSARSWQNVLTNVRFLGIDNVMMKKQPKLNHTYVLFWEEINDTVRRKFHC